MSMRKNRQECEQVVEKERKKKGEKINWKPWIIIGLVIVLILGGIFAKTYVMDGYMVLARQVRFEKEDGGYYDAKNDRHYRVAPDYYEPFAYVADPVYGRVGGVNLFTPGKWEDMVHLYRVCYSIGSGSDKSNIGTDTAVWLATDRDHGMELYYNTEYTLPDPAEFEFETVYLCDGAIALYQLDDAASLRVMEDFFDESAENLYGGEEFMMAKSVKTLRVTSSRYQWIRMVLQLYQYEDEYYIYLREQQRFVKTDADVFSVYFAIEEMGSSESGVDS